MRCQPRRTASAPVATVWRRALTTLTERRRPHDVRDTSASATPIASTAPNTTVAAIRSWGMATSAATDGIAARAINPAAAISTLTIATTRLLSAANDEICVGE